MYIKGIFLNCEKCKESTRHQKFVQEKTKYQLYQCEQCNNIRYKKDNKEKLYKLIRGMKDKNMSDIEIAKIAGVSRQWINHILTFKGKYL